MNDEAAEGFFAAGTGKWKSRKLSMGMLLSWSGRWGMSRAYHVLNKLRNQVLLFDIEMGTRFAYCSLREFYAAREFLA